MCERLAAPLQEIDLAIRRGDHADDALDEALLLRLHAALSNELYPADAGRYRTTNVQVSAHEPPAYPLVPGRMRDYTANLAARIAHWGGEPDELLLELLAYAEGELLSIHPFADLNGRISRLWMTELLRRLALPPVAVVPATPDFRQRYLQALAAADARRWHPLMALWKERLRQPAVLNDIVLTGCMPTPLASYLKALAVLRIVAESDGDGGDAEAGGFWRDDDVFVLTTRLDAKQLESLLLHRWRPTPLVAPWNGGSGFYPKDRRTGIDALAASSSERYAAYRDAIAVGRSLVKRGGWTESPKDAAKATLLQSLRNAASDTLLAWLDAAVILAGDEPRYPPLLGTGGNDGRLDFTNNFMQRLVELFDTATGAPRPRAEPALRAALYGSADTMAASGAVGQFAPGAAGGPNGSIGFEADSGLNDWDYVLMLEGAMLFAASAVRRLESSDPGILTAPFTVRSRVASSSGTGADDDMQSRGELWMPLWRTPCSLPELRHLLGEGRSAVNGRASRDGLDFARAVAQLGVDRGVDSFQRYALLMRSGKAFLATPLERVTVRRNPDADLITELEREQWLAAVQRHSRDDNAPHGFRSAARRLDTALFEWTRKPGPGAAQAVLRQLGRIEAALHTSRKSREAVPRPQPRLSSAWAQAADDGSSEFRIALALAGLELRDATGRAMLHARRHLAGVGESHGSQGRRDWDGDSRLAVWRHASLPSDLAALLQRRRLDVAPLGQSCELLASTVLATRSDLARLLAGSTDDRRISELFAGLASVDLSQGHHAFVAPPGATLLPAFAALKAVFTPETVLRATRLFPDDVFPGLPGEIPARLASGDTATAVRLAWQRLRAVGVALPGRNPPTAVAANGPRWLAALCVPLTVPETAQMLRSLVPTEDS